MTIDFGTAKALGSDPDALNEVVDELTPIANTLLDLLEKAQASGQWQRLAALLAKFTSDMVAALMNEGFERDEALALVSSFQSGLGRGVKSS